MQPDWQPALAGDHVVLRPVCADDWTGMFAAAADPAIWAGHPASDRYEEDAFRAFFDGALASRAALTILDRRSGAIIGSSRYDHYEPELRQVEIGWTFLARSVWGGTYNGEIKRLMLDHAFRFVDTVVFTVDEANMRSRRAIEKIGGVLRPETFDRRYGEVDVTQLIYEIRKPSTPGAAAVCDRAAGSPARDLLSPRILIRSATSADAAAISGLMDQLGYAAVPDLIAHKLDVLSRSADETVLLAIVDERVAGCLSAHAHELFHVPGRLGRVTSMVVDAAIRGHGIGRALIDRAMEFFRERGCLRVEVTSGDHRPGAHAFYRSVGFVVDERRFVRRLNPGQAPDSSAARGGG